MAVRLFLRFTLWCLGAGIVLGSDPALREVRPLSAAGEARSSEGPLFLSIPATDSGLDLVIPIDTSHPDKRLYYSAMACGSVAAGDLDGDGWPELFFAAGPVPNRLYRHLGASNGPRFVDVTAEAGVADADSWCTGAAMADIDDDGDLDLFVCRYDAPNRLYLNESTPGSFRFREAAAEWGLDLVDASLMPAFADYDRDGDLDLFLAVNAYYNKGGRPSTGVPIRKTDDGWEMLPPWDRYYVISSVDPATGAPRFDEAGRPNRLYRREGNRFEEVSDEAGLLRTPSHTNACAWWDYDGDGWLDLYVGNDFSDRDELYRNLGNGTFAEVAPDVLQHTTWFTMGMAAEDFNGDGRSDLVVADMLPSTHYREKVTMGEMGASFAAMYRSGLPHQRMVNSFFINTGTGFFLEAARQWGIASTDWTWTVKSGDLDGDGRIDLYFPTGHTRDFNHSDFKRALPEGRIARDDWDLFEDRPELRESDLVFRNAADWRFEPAGAAWNLGREKTMTYGATLSDLDRDGDLDLVTIPLEDPPALHLNQTAERGMAGHLLLALDGRPGNRRGIGARVTIETPDGHRQTRTLLPNNGYQESDEPLVHFGLGGAATITSLTVDWPSGARQTFSDLNPNRWLSITEPESGEAGATLPPPGEPESVPWFRPSALFQTLSAPETPFDDYARQPLLPHRHSQLGPGQAWSDIDGDGRADLYLGGPRGQPGRMLLHRGSDPRGEPVFALRQRDPFVRMIPFEDMGSLFFDADSDGDQDLLVISGGVECEPGDPSLADRLFLNDGSGGFVEATDRLPDPGADGHASGSAAAAADFDRDGDLDVFIGGRVVPGSFPLPAVNRLLVNDGSGRFTDRAAEHHLDRTGMVTAALWSDADGDGWMDLLVAHEWGPIRCFANRRGSLVEVTSESGLAGATGFWNSLAGRDLDGDGDIDYLAGNLGRNSKYRASSKEPELLYYGDFDGSGRSNLIEAKIEHDTGRLLPRRGLSCSGRAMPLIREQTQTFQKWASSSLEQLYSETRLSQALRLEATTLESVLLINDGEGRFAIQPLPPLAQVAPVFGIALSDLDADGFADAVLAQNDFSPQEETGPLDGGLSLVLRGTSDGFSEIWPLQSGLVVPGDAKSVGISDLNGDHLPDLVFGINQAPPQVFLRSRENRPAGIPLMIDLAGSSGNPTSIGARVTVAISGLPDQTAEVSAGSGYLTQQPSTLWFGWGPDTDPATIASVTIHWPNGEISNHSLAKRSGPRYKVSAD